MAARVHSDSVLVVSRVPDAALNVRLSFPAPPVQSGGHVVAPIADTEPDLLPQSPAEDGRTVVRVDSGTHVPCTLNKDSNVFR